jgi:Protein of unknown function (DUF2490)
MESSSYQAAGASTTRPNGYQRYASLQRIRTIVALQRFLLTFVFLISFCELAKAQEAEFLPEVDVYLKLNVNFRLRVQALNTREGGDPTQPAIGPYLDFYAKPLIRLRQVTAYDLDEAKARPLVLAAGYNFIDPPGAPSTNRMILTATSHLPMRPGLLLSDRNRADLDWSNGKFNWRYRNKLEVEKPVVIHSYHPAPYASVEVYYESQYQKWSTTEIYAGCLFPIKKHFELDPYYEHQNNTGKSPNSQLNGFGLTLNVFLSVK